MTSFLTSGPECSYLLSSTSESTSSTGSTLRFELHARGRGALPPCALGSLTVTNPFFNQTQSGIQQALPLGIKQGNIILQYVWDGKGVKALDEFTLRDGGDSPVGRMRRAIFQWQDQMYKAFIPSTKDVSSDYWEWLKWRLSQRFFSSTMQNLSTQSLLLALGLGAKKTIAASAVINWLLKDGVGRIARMTVATNLCQSFDSELKHFLALASIANAGKAIALSAYVSTAPAFQRALCTGGNLADLTAKNQAQHMVIDMLALAVSAGCMYAVRNSERGRILLPLFAYPILAAADLWSIYNELQAVELKMLNRERSEMLAEQWVATGRAPSAAEISRKERLLLPPDIGGGLLPLTITSVDRLIGRPEEVSPLLQRYKRDQYMMAIRDVGLDPPSGIRMPWSPKTGPELRLSFSEDAESSHMLQAILESAYLRKLVRVRMEDKLQASRLGQSIPGPPAMRSIKDGSSTPAVLQRTPSASSEGHLTGDALWASAGPLMGPGEMESCVGEARRHAQQDVGRFLKDLQGQGWKTRTVLLSTSEKVRYVKLLS